MKNHILVAAIFAIILSTADGVLTYIGLTRGLALEGNPFVGYFINLIGLVPALFLTRVMTFFSIAYIASVGSQKALLFTNFLIASCAVVPWTMLILFQ